MPSDPVEPDRAARRAALLDAADRVIRQAGPAASMTRIAAEAGVTKPILYHHFGDKGGLYGALAERYLAPLLTAVRRALGASPDPQARVRAAVGAYLAFVEQNRQTYRFLMDHAVAEEPAARTAVSATIRRLGDEVGAVLHGQRRLAGTDAATADALGHGIVGMVHVAAAWWLEDQRLTRAELTERLSRMLLSGLGGFTAAR